MKKIAVFGLLPFLLSGLLAQQVIENPEKPLNPNAGRTILLREVLRIKDEGKGFFFKEPWGLDVAPDGSIFVQDGRALYKFSPGGRFERNLIKTGQGPGEISSDLSGFLFQQAAVVVLSAPNKLLKMDFAGKLLQEWKFDQKFFSRLIAFHNGKYHLLSQRMKLDRSVGFKEREFNLFRLNENGALQPTLCVLKTLIDLRVGSRGSSVSDITGLNFTPENRGFVYIANTQEYEVKQLDLDKAEITKIFRRPYPRVKSQKKDPRDPRQLPAFDNDVYRLLIHRDQVWALTSTYDPIKGILVDVFDNEGKYLNNFRLLLLNIRTGDAFFQRYFPVIIRGDYLYALEHNADWAYSVAKYEIEPGGSLEFTHPRF